jgi:hypothetical protein
MLSKVLWRNKMLPEVGIVNFIDFKIKFILIGLEYKNKLNHLLKHNKMITIKLKLKY